MTNGQKRWRVVADEDQSQIRNLKLETDNEGAGSGLETLGVSCKKICTIVFPGHMGEMQKEECRRKKNPKNTRLYSPGT
jgi:hypothetical protein